MFLIQPFFWGGWMTQQRSVIPDKSFIITAMMQRYGFGGGRVLPVGAPIPL
jgi:hypothetical protein